MTSFSEMTKKEFDEEEVIGNIKPEIRTIVELSNRIDSSKLKSFYYFSGTKKELNKILYGKTK